MIEEKCQESLLGAGYIFFLIKLLSLTGRSLRSCAKRLTGSPMGGSPAKRTLALSGNPSFLSVALGLFVAVLNPRPVGKTALRRLYRIQALGGSLRKGRHESLIDDDACLKIQQRL